jgi:hypothetical protein
VKNALKIQVFNMGVLLLEIGYKLTVILSHKPESVRLESQAAFDLTLKRAEAEGFAIKDV